jgi:hypothetical protein
MPDLTHLGGVKLIFERNILLSQKCWTEPLFAPTFEAK